MDSTNYNNMWKQEVKYRNRGTTIFSNMKMKLKYDTNYSNNEIINESTVPGWW